MEFMHFMHLMQLVGDQPLISELIYENRTKYENSFHIQIALMEIINKRFWNGLSDLAVAAELVQYGLVEQTLKGKHYDRCM